ncbi:hypothetical protein HDU92_005234 [Lobulomyces angularis]|nr:hypothetical protein HDU92_005234 [Lobulomyces angularis]
MTTIYCPTVEKSINALNMFKYNHFENNSSIALGFDIEWEVDSVKGKCLNKTAVVQLSNETTILIFHLVKMTFPLQLREILENGSIIKAGINIKQDCQKLYKDYNINSNGLLDLKDLAKQLPNEEKENSFSLQSLLERHCRYTIEKNEGSARCSNWERIPLTATQLRYAANDCYAHFCIFQSLIKKRDNVKSLQKENFTLILKSGIKTYVKEKEEKMKEEEKLDSKRVKYNKSTLEVDFFDDVESVQKVEKVDCFDIDCATFANIIPETLNFSEGSIKFKSNAEINEKIKFENNLSNDSTLHLSKVEFPMVTDAHSNPFTEKNWKLEKINQKSNNLLLQSVDNMNFLYLENKYNFLDIETQNNEDDEFFLDSKKMSMLRTAFK